MRDQELFAMVVIAIAVCASLTKLGLALLRRGERQPTMEAPPNETRLARIEHAVEAIAIEVERVSESQRFAARLLAGQAPQGARAIVADPRHPEVSHGH